MMNKKARSATKNWPVRRSLYIAIAAVSQVMISTQVLANPEGGQVVGGRGSIDQSGLSTTINQHTDRMAIDWQSFNVDADERVQFIQPSSSSIALNRVLSHSGSEIHGQIEANGHIVLVNPNGVFFGENSRINVGGMIASGLNIDPNDFMNGDFTLTAMEGTEGKVINSGIINAATGGSVTLVGRQVKNESLISAKLGAVNLAAGKEAVVTFDNSGLVGIKVTKEILQNEFGLDAAVINSGEINAEGGRILLTASTSQDIFSQAVNSGNMNKAASVVMHEDGSFTLGAGSDVVNTGSLNASSNANKAGQVVILGENITTSGEIFADAQTNHAGNIELHSTDTTLVTESGMVSAQSASKGNGGKIKILGKKVGLLDHARVNASGAEGGGEILIGGDESGQNNRIRNANFIYLSENSAASANGIIDGNGGKLITFANDTARIYGDLSASGGQNRGNGGFIETSGLKGFEILKTPDVSSSKEDAGTWLIDPYDIRIQDTDLLNIVPAENKFESTSSTSNIKPSTISTALSNGSSVIITTGAFGDITLVDNIEFNISDNKRATLTLNSHNQIILSQNKFISRVSNGAGSLNVILNANLDGDNETDGNITFNAGSYINTYGGNFSATGLNIDLLDSSSTAIETSGGDVNFVMSGSISLGSAIKTGGGSFTVESSTSFTNSESYIDTAGGTVSINSDGHVTLNDKSSEGITLGASNILGNFVLTSDEGIKQVVALVIEGETTLDAGGNAVDLSNAENNFHKIVRASNTSSFKLTDIDGLTVGAITTSGQDNQDAGEIKITAGGSLTTGALTASGGAATAGNVGKNGGVISLGADSNITVNGSIKSNGSNGAGSRNGGNWLSSRNGGSGESVSITSVNGSVTVSTIDTSGGDGHSSYSSDKDNGGNAGAIEINAGNSGSITLTGNLSAQGGGRERGVNGSGANIDLRGNVKLVGNTVIHAGVKGNVEDGDTRGNLHVTGTIDSETSGSNPNLTITAKDINFNENVGGSDSESALGTLSLDATGEIVAKSAESVSEFKNINVSSLKSYAKTNFYVGNIITNGGTAEITANSIRVGTIDSSSATDNGGTIKLIAKSDGATINLAGDINSSSIEGTTQGDIEIRLESAGTVSLNHNAFTSKVELVGSDDGNSKDTLNGFNVENTWLINNKGSGEIGNISFSRFEALNGGTAEDIFQFDLDANDFGNSRDILDVIGYMDIDGKGGINTIDLSDITNLSESKSLTYTLGSDDVSSIKSVSHIKGNNSSYMTLSIKGGGNFWNIFDFDADGYTSDGVNDGTVANSRESNTPIYFIDFKSLQGSDGDDTFIFTKEKSGTIGAIDGGDGTNTLEGKHADSTWTFSGENEGEVALNTATGSPYVNFKNIGFVKGGDENDSFKFLENGQAKRINGGGGDGNTIVGRNKENIWNVASAGSLTEKDKGAYVNSFSNIQILEGGSHIDTFNINDDSVSTIFGHGDDDFFSIKSAFTGTISAGAGNDTFNVEASANTLRGEEGDDRFIFLNGGRADLVDGGDHSNTLFGRDNNNSWTLTGVDAGTLGLENESTNYVVEFKNINILEGGSGTDTLNGYDQYNKWLIDGFNSGSLGEGTADTSTYTRFAGMENIVGSASQDDFVFINTDSDITGLIDGGDTDLIIDTLDIRALTNGVNVELSPDNLNSTNLHVTNVEEITASPLESANNYIFGAADQSYTWVVDGVNTGTIEPGNSETEYQVRFKNFNHLQGGDNDDSFTIVDTGNISGSIHGGNRNGTDIVDYSQQQSHVNIILGGNGSQGATGINGIERIVGNNNGLGGAEFNSSIWVENGNNNWVIGSTTDVNDDRDGVNDGKVSVNGSSAILFEDFNVITGGSGKDDFTFTSNGIFAGYIDGGNGTNTYNTQSSTLDQTIHLRKNKPNLSDPDAVTLSSNITQLFNFGEVKANTTKANHLISGDASNQWSIRANDNNSVTLDDVNQVSFSGFSHLRGGNGADIFEVYSLNNLVKNIDGGSGNATDIVSLTRVSADTAVTIGVGNASQVDLSVSGIESIQANGNAGNKLVAEAAGNWIISDKNSGSFDKLLFSGFGYLTGGAGNDVFEFSNANASLTGIIDGGAGADTLNLEDLGHTMTVGLSTEKAADVKVANLETITANNAYSNTLIAGNDSNLWSISGRNGGVLKASESETSFTGFHNLIGGSGNDQFTFGAKAVLDGYVDGGGQPEGGEDTVDLEDLSSVEILLGGELGYRGIEKFIGNNTDSTLRASGANTWNLTGVNTGNVNNAISFEGFTSLTGGEGIDRFNLEQGSLSGSVHGQGGDDVFVVGNNVNIGGSIYGELGDDSLLVNVPGAATGLVNFIGGDGSNSITVIGGGSGYSASHFFDAANSGELSYSDPSKNVYRVTYSDTDSITDNLTAASLTVNDTAQVDRILLGAGTYSLEGFTAVSYANKTDLLIAAAADDQVVIEGAVNISGLLTVQDAQVSALAGGSITATGLRLERTKSVGALGNQLKVNITDLFVTSTNGAIYLREDNSLNIAEFSPNATINLHLRDDLTSSIALQSLQDISITTSNGNIVLDKENSLSGGLNLAARDSINLRNQMTTNLKNVSAGSLTVNSTGIINGVGLIQVGGLASLKSGGDINLDNQDHRFKSVDIGSAANVSINNVDSLRLTGVTASGALNINAQGINVDGPIDTASVMLNAGQGDAVLSGNVAVDGKANVVGRNIAVDGDLLAANIQLDGSQGQVLINGRLNTVGKESITVAANQVVQNGRMSAGTGVTMQASDSITQNAGITAGTDVLLSAGGDLFTNGRHTTQGQQVNYSAGGNMGLADIDATKGIKISAAGSVNQSGNIASSTGDIVIDSGRYNMEAGSALTASAGSVLLASSADVTTRKISAATEVSLTASGNAQILDEVTTDGAISIQGGSITLASNLIGNTGIDVVSANGNIQQEAQLNSAQGDIRVVANGDITMGAGSSTLSTNGNINYSGANLGITSFDALKTVTLAATRGAVTDVNGNDNNITAQRLLIDAATGIGSNDIIETLVEQLSVSNNVGDIRLQNNKAVTVDRLRSNGNIVFNNLVGGVTLDNSQGTLFSRTETDARLAGGTMNANYDIGTLTINVAAGDLTATGVADLKNPDIVARNAALIAPIGNIGTFGRPLVIYVKDSLFIAGFNSWNPFWAFGVSPATVDNASTIQGDLSDLLASGNETLVVVEALNEVDPAIFTNVRNYFYDDVSILLPTDQLYYGE
jgi:filamentous hemagglutinin family protein